MRNIVVVRYNYGFCCIRRIAAEQRITDLQSLVDETFQQFALDDSEDDIDFEESDCTIPAATVESMLFPYHRASQPLLSLPTQPLGYRLPLKTYLSSPTLTK